MRYTARDGVELSADIYRPDDTTPHPVLLIRSLHGKASSVGSGEVEPPVLTRVERGYIIVLQDCRDTGLSDGEFKFYENEGADAIQWCAATLVQRSGTAAVLPVEVWRFSCRRPCP